MTVSAWICTDCEAEVHENDRREHMREEHGVTYAVPSRFCTACRQAPCERAELLEQTIRVCPTCGADNVLKGVIQTWSCLRCKRVSTEGSDG